MTIRLTPKAKQKIENTFLSRLGPVRLEEKLAESYLGILVDDETIFNPLENLPTCAHDKFPEYIMWLMSQPDYFYFLMKYVLQIDSWPMQCVMLKELFSHRFPMLLGSRGLSKSFTLAVYILIRMILVPNSKCIITSAGFRQAKVIFDYMETIWKKSLVLQNCFKGGKNGPTHGTDVWTFRLGDSICYALPVGPDGSKVRGYRANCVYKDTLIQTDIGLVKINEYLKHDCYKVLNRNLSLEMPDKIYKTVPTDVYKIITANGYSIKCSKLHRLLVTDGKKTSWKLAKDLLDTDYLELDNNDYFPNKYIEYDGLKVDEDMGYLLGLLVSEGTVTNRNFISISHTNKKLIDEIISKFNNFNWSLATREAKVDSRGWNCKKCYNLTYSSVEFREKLKFLGVDNIGALQKEIPWCILQSPRSVVIEFLKGLMIGDGSCFRYSSRGKTHVGVTYYSSSENLINQLQILLLKFNITCCKNKKYTKISGNPNYMLAMRGEQAFKIYDLVQNQYWYDHIIKDGFKFERSMNFRKKGNSFLVGTTRCDKNIYIGSYKTIEESEKAFQDYYKTVRPAVRVKTVELLPEQEALYDFVMPETESFLGGGFVNHNCLINDEFSSMNRQVFEEVMSGFLSVASSPIEQIQHTAKKSAMKSLSIPIGKHDSSNDFIKNQLILSGTAYYKVNHFYAYFKKWHDIISATGDRKKLKAIFGEENIQYVDSKDYCIIRVPVELVTSGYMDMEQVSRIKASTTKDVYLREYNACFSDDSDGFFRKSLIDSCTAQELDKSTFPPMLYGDKTKKYVYGVDPAYEGDNFAIVILELNGPSRRVVHAWTTQASDHKDKIRDGVVTENDYYHYCARKIRNLMKRFPCEFIAIDPQGGGRAIIEAFMDQTKLLENELIILPTIEPEEKAKETDIMTGLHIVKIINFTPNWISDANHALKKDMEDKSLMFPFTDEISYALAEYYDESSGESKTLYDTLDDCIYEIDELKKELTTVVITETSTGKEKFDTPSIKTGINKKGRLKKDRYSALLLSNWVARSIILDESQFSNPDTKTMSGFVAIGKNKGSLYVGNAKIAKQLQSLYDLE